ncbi:DNA-binding FadR family transcriptional regulator [Amycolatopsis magusensis]|uniref:DNA-binding FadR family transcriptional regulator n=2 Tax=Amycolatopsis magusensis TaxID=882444 RepID=A0ABS4Q086_9PSEU|nr:DNA-binding FadR family transcriptional regulator [Amycolatopsis magusensis]
MTAMEAVLGEIRGAIERGEYHVGDKLPAEAAMAQTFGVSRSVIREALRASAALGLTVSRTGKGTYVQAAGAAQNPIFGSYSARDLLEVRRHVEIPVAGYAALRRGADDLDRLASLTERMRQETDDTAWVALDTLFHISVAQASGNPVFAKVIEEIRDALRQQSFFLNKLADRRERSNREHEVIVEAIGSGAVEAAEGAMTVHLELVEKSLSAVVAS